MRAVAQGAFSGGQRDADGVYRGAHAIGELPSGISPLGCASRDVVSPAMMPMLMPCGDTDARLGDVDAARMYRVRRSASRRGIHVLRVRWSGCLTTQSIHSASHDVEAVFFFPPPRLHGFPALHEHGLGPGDNRNKLRNSTPGNHKS